MLFAFASAEVFNPAACAGKAEQPTRLLPAQGDRKGFKNSKNSQFRKGALSSKSTTTSSLIFALRDAPPDATLTASAAKKVDRYSTTAPHERGQRMNKSGKQSQSIEIAATDRAVCNPRLRAGLGWLAFFWGTIKQ